MQKLLVICGPTAVGKTEIGVRLAKKFCGEIVSADSKQVYRGLDIATGKDLPKSAKLKVQSEKLQLKAYRFNGIPIWMMDVADPKENFSVADYHKLAIRVIDGVWQRDKLPIIVGGTGFYIKALVDGIETLGVPPNPQLRVAYSKKPAEELFDILFHLAPDVANSLNESERKNKQRLIRRIEVAQQKWKARSGKEIDDISIYHHKANVLFIGLTILPEVLKVRIEQRIDKWIIEGAEDEVLKLLGSGVRWEHQSMFGIGYREWEPFFQGKATRDEVIKKWKQNEWQYAKRQLTWFKKDKRIKWFDVTNKRWEERVENMVRIWYNRK